MGDRIVKRRKWNSKRRRNISLLLMVSIFIMFAVGPFVFRMEHLRQAKSTYDIVKVQDELLWLEKHGGLLNNLKLLKETRLWLELNLGAEDIEQKLVSSQYQDEKHQFWLTIVYLQAGDLTKVENLLETMDPSPRRQLGKGFQALAKGDAEQIRELLAETEADWKSMTRQEQCLRHLTLTQAAMILEDYPTTKVELETAQQLDPNNPACLSVEFDVALAQGQWAKALELSLLIDDQTWRPQNSLYQTKRAVLAIHETNPVTLSESLTSLKKLPQGDAITNYLNGIIALKKGHLQEGKTLLELSLKNGLEGEVQDDAQKALKQVSERQNAERVISSW